MSDRDLLQKRSAEEKKYLRDHMAAIRSDPDVIAAGRAYNTEPARFTPEALQSGVIIDGFACRLTPGTLALLRSAQARCLGYEPEKGGLRKYDVWLGVFLMADECRNEAISVIGDDDELRAAVRKFGRKVNAKTAGGQLFEFFTRQGRALGYVMPPQSGEGDKGKAEPAGDAWRAPDDAWVDDLDLVAKEYGWNDNYILWEVPVVRISRLKDAIRARRAGKPRTNCGDQRSIQYLQAIERAGERLKKKEAENG